jgi:uncharacterized membrane protein YraQ (UPF0718 family)
MGRAAKMTEAARQTASTFLRTVPVVLGVLALASLATAAFPPQQLAEALPLDSLFGPVLGALVGSIAAGHPVTSYVLAGELTAAGATLATVTALIVSWVTVGVVHLPAEAASLGARFALWRNATSFVLAVLMAYVIALAFGLGS